MILKTFKIRIYPTTQQEQLFYKHIGACRYVWNYMLDLQKHRYQNGEKCLTGFGMIKLLKPLKNDEKHEWLKEVSNKSLQRICSDLGEAYSRYFSKISRHPKFKTKK